MNEKDIAEMMGIDIEHDPDVVIPGSAMVVNDPVKSTDVVVPLKVDDNDILVDYTLSRNWIVATQDQAFEILQTVSQMVKSNPTPQSVDSATRLIRTITENSTALFEIHKKIADHIGWKGKPADGSPSADQGVTMKELLDGIRLAKEGGTNVES